MLAVSVFKSLILRLDIVTLVTTAIFDYFSLGYKCFNDCSYDFSPDPVARENSGKFLNAFTNVYALCN